MFEEYDLLNYLRWINHELSKYKSELDELTKEKETLLNEKDVLNQKISEIEEENNNKKIIKFKNLRF